MANTEEIAGVMFYIQVCKLLTNTLSVYPQPPSHPHSSVHLSSAFLQPHRLLAQPFLHLHMVSSIHASIIGGSSLHRGSYCSLQNFQPQSVCECRVISLGDKICPHMQLPCTRARFKCCNKAPFDGGIFSGSCFLR